MRGRIAAAALAVIVVALAAASVLLWVRGGTPAEDDSVLFGLLYLTAFLLFALVGVLIAWRRPENPVGWLLATAAIVVFLEETLRSYAALAATPQALTGGPVAQWIAYSLWPATVTLLVLLLLVFPTGRTASPRWRWFACAVGIGGLILLVVNAAEAWSLRGSLHLADPNPFPGPLGIAVQGLAVFVVGSIAVAASGLVLRFRASKGLERRQLKLLALAMGLLGFGVASGIVLDLLGWGAVTLTAIGWSVGLLGIPVATGVAVLRYRLYDIDRMVSRTVSYVVLTALLAGVYIGGVVVLGGLVRSLSGGGGGDLVVAASTLAVAALFGPARRRIQELVDRRFNRARYDAQRTVEAFGQRLRDEVELEALDRELREAVTASLQPVGVSVWLRRRAEVAR